MKHVLSIAGSDCSGGAGIQADLKAFSACGVYGMTVITALTAQNTRGVRSVQVVDAAFVGEQIDAVFDDIRVDAVKIGMLPNPQIMTIVAQRLEKYKPAVVVVDPVMVAKSGHALMPPEAVAVFKDLLVPLADLLTPNLPEAEALTGFLPASLHDMSQAGEKLLALGARAVLVKGGHSTGRPDDVLVTPKGSQVFEGVRHQNIHTHGTGCSLSSALAAFLARGLPLETAVRSAKDYVSQGIRQGLLIGGGIGPIHHFWNFWNTQESSDQEVSV